VTGVVVAAPADVTNPLKGDGWTLKLRDGWRVVAGERAGSWKVAR
jgi:hypothetical protein